VCLFAKIEVVLPCGHAFCEACITDWLKKQRECPLCRQSIGTRLSCINKKNSGSSSGDFQESFFELIDIDGKDDVTDDLESNVQ